MGWDAKYVNYGVIKIDTSFKVVRVYYSESNYENIHVEALSASWAGDCVLITRKDGRMVKYKNTANYDYV